MLWEQGVAGSNPVAPTIHKNKRSAVTGWPLFVMGFSLLSAWQARNKKPPAMRVETIRYTHKNTFPLR